MELRARRALIEGIARNAGGTARIGEFHFARFPIATDIGIFGAFRYDGRDIHTVTRDDISALVDTIANFAKATLSGSG